MRSANSYSHAETVALFCLCDHARIVAPGELSPPGRASCRFDCMHHGARLFFHNMQLHNTICAP